jgi:hypothetical protein
MKLMTKEIEAKLPALYSQEKVKDPMVVAKFFDPAGSWTWYVIEGSKEGDDTIFYGLVKGHEIELGNFSLNELQSFKGRFGLGIERDIHWRPRPLSEVRSALEERGHI